MSPDQQRHWTAVGSFVGLLWVGIVAWGIVLGSLYVWVWGS